MNQLGGVRLVVPLRHGHPKTGPGLALADEIAVLYDALSGFRVGAVTRLPDGQFSFEVAGVAGRVFILESSTNLMTWTELDARTSAGGAIQLMNRIDPDIPQPFFRVKSRP